MMPNVVNSKQHGHDLVTQEAVKICATNRGPALRQSSSKFKLTKQSKQVAHWNIKTPSEIPQDFEQVRRLVGQSVLPSLEWSIDNIKLRHVFDKAGKPYLIDLMDYKLIYKG